MPEPVTTTTTVAISSSASGVLSVGLSTLFIGWFGQAGAEVMMIILAAIAGCSVGLSGQNKSYTESIVFILRGVLVSVVLAKAISFGLVQYYPALDNQFLPSTVAFLLGFSVDKLPAYLTGVISFVTQRVRGVSNDTK